MAEIYQVIAKLLDGKSKTLNFTTPEISAASIKSRIQQLTSIPVHDQLLLINGKQLPDSNKTLISAGPGCPTVHLLLRLRGGKGGFGSLLRGAATKAGQKKANNFDACRDMSGRRLRHVNAEKKMEEWKEQEKERKLEKIAEEFIKKRAKEAKKGGGGGSEADKYVEKYRKDSAKCMEEVDKSVRESLGSVLKSKRKVSGLDGVDNGAKSKKFKIWLGKRKLDGSDSDESNEDDMDEENGENEKSVVINNENQSNSNKETDGSSGSITGGKVDGESSVGCSSESSSEEEKETIPDEPLGSFNVSDDGSPHAKRDDMNKPESKIQEESILQNVDVPKPVLPEIKNSTAIEMVNVEETASELPSISGAQEAGIEADQNSDVKPVADEEAAVAKSNIPDFTKPLSFDDFSSAAEMEVLGMDRLKSELQEHGLKCGGTLQERAARLFLLKTTPLEMLPKKLLAKK